MRRMPSLLPLAGSAFLVATLSIDPAQLAPTAADPRAVRIGLQKVLTGLSAPVGMAAVPDGSSRYVVVERGGTVRMVRNGVLQQRPYLDIRARVRTAGEGGLLSVAFAPNFASTGYFFAAYTDTSGALRVSRFRAAPPSSDAAPATETTVLSVAHPTYDNHYGGQLAFGPRSLLYISTGDGGGGGDPRANAQNYGSLLGKVLRIDVSRGSGGRAYSIPSDNPFVGRAGARPEIWALGLRNPWRFSFDRADASMYLGDVGQYHREEVDWVPRESGGRNFGWDCREGTLDTTGRYAGSYCFGRRFTPPVHEYTHAYGCAVIGGHVYRGTRYRALLDGVYVFGDFCSGRIWGLARQSDGRWLRAQLYDYTGNVMAFGQDAGGEVYVLAASGDVFRVVASRR